MNWTGEDPALGQLAVDILRESVPVVQEFLPLTEYDPDAGLYLPDFSRFKSGAAPDRA